ncbi:hypothetical protein M9978_07180 [Sphingomonas sp. MG17]|uniref:Dolichyl-phosphate-mannose-protein mannosyltransferase n=1 Tax=Sphingomonas tagetis TaxID=2949092 RepID=A0A9X2KKY2_9SPHN|nr:hypothetical protein [Sphingomonas tagetis]MCP3730210.1 hypothetical protein [Sphingomonas tagetis]
MGEIIERRCWWIVAAIAAGGLALRIAAAQGGLWLDEAWSAVMAAEAGTPLGAFLHINHDNNHHLNTLWLQLVGLDASPLLQRTLSIATGTASILMAARIGARRNASTAIVAALLFALSPILVTYGSEARGYAPMLLAFLTAIDLIDRWLAEPAAPRPAIPLALAAFLGLLAQLTMAFALAALGLWTIWSLRKGLALWPAIARLWGPAAMASATALALIFVPAWLGGGMAFGAAEPFTLAHWTVGLWQAFGHTFGNAWGFVAIGGAALLLLGMPIGRLAACGYAALLAAPLIVLIAQVPNAAVARLYLTASAGALLLFALLLGNGFARGQRGMAIVIAACALAIMGYACATLVQDRRADPARALTAIATRAPTGADAAVERPRSDAILIAAAASARYPLQIRQTCPAARFLFIERDGAEAFPAVPTHCATRYREIAGDTVQGLSGTQWKLYERSDR